jgi:hypothetical protein
VIEVGEVKPIADGASASLTIGGINMRLYMRGTLTLVRQTRGRRSAEAAAKALRALGVPAEARRGAGGVWHVVATTNRLAEAAPELREAVARAVKMAVEAGYVPERRARRWLEKLEGGRAAGRYSVTPTKKGALMIRYMTTNAEGLEREAQRLREMGLVEGFHFVLKPPEGGRPGYVYVRREGLRRTAAMAARGNPTAAELLEQILQKVGERVRKIVEEGRAVGSLKLTEVRAEVEAGGKRHSVEVLSWDTEWNERRLQISILAEVDGVEEWHSATFYRRGRRVEGAAYAKASAPGGAEAYAERFAALMKALTGREPKAHTVRGKPAFFLSRAYLDALARYAELAEIVEGWLVASWFANLIILN